MADNGWQMEVRIEDTTNDRCKLPLVNSGGSPATVSGFLLGRGRVLGGLYAAGGGSPITTNWYARQNVSDISGYLRLRNANSNDLYVATCVTDGEVDADLPCEEWSTDAGDLDGVTMTAETVSILTRARWIKVGAPPNPLSVTAMWELYHRTSGGTESLITSWSHALTTSYQNFSSSKTITKAWGTNERAVLKVWGKFRKQAGS